MSMAAWQELGDDALLEWRMCDLDLSIEGSGLELPITALHGELQSRGLAFFPRCYLGDEWFVAEGATAIAIPFYLAHPRLRKLESTHMLEVEGGSDEECMKLLRHEAGHAFMYAFRLHRKRKYRELFGPSTTPYEEQYTPRPYSRSYVRHLNHWYAQSHPDEDFAETFAVWLTPDSQWRTIYHGWKAYEKLTWVDQTMTQLMKASPCITSVRTPLQISALKRKLRTHYQRRRRENAADFPDFFDADLLRLFKVPEFGERQATAAKFMRQYHRRLLTSVARWTGVKKYHIAQLITQLTHRCHALHLRISHGEEETFIDVTSYLTTLMMNYLHTGQLKRTH